MNTSRARGFTLLELLLAVALAAVVAAAASAAMGLFAELDLRAVQGTELRVDVQRVLQMVRRDVALANTIDLQPNQLQLGYDDGTVVVYAMPPGGTELDRFSAVGIASLLLPVQTVLTSIATPPQYDARGHLRDAWYAATAVLQGAQGMSGSTIRSALDGEVVGVVLRIAHVDGDNTVVSSVAAVSRPLSEKHTRP